MSFKNLHPVLTDQKYHVRKSYEKLPCGCIPGFRTCDKAKSLQRDVNDAFAEYSKVKKSKDKNLADTAWKAYKNAMTSFNNHWLAKGE